MAPRYRLLLLPFGVCDESDAYVDLDNDQLQVRFGHWGLSTPVRNLAGAQVLGPFSAPKVLGPHLSLADRGATFGSSTAHGVCIRFHTPVPGLEPTGALRHPGVTVTVAEPQALARAVEHHAAAQRIHTARRAEPTPQPGAARRAAAVLRYPVGLALSTARYALWSSRVERTEQAGDADDLPPALPDRFVDAHLKTIEDGAGPLLHRTFRVSVRDADTDATGLIDRITADLDRAAPSEVTSFRKTRGRLGGLSLGDEYIVQMPAPWNGPVRVVNRDARSFRFATLAHHLEAGQIEFAAHDGDHGLEFGIEAWSRPGDRAAALVFDQLKIGKEIQLHMWTQFCVSACELANGHVDGPIRIRTRRASWPLAPATPSQPVRSINNHGRRRLTPTSDL
ncbi:DUF1990 family protein [Pseudonocardia sp. KRD291]|uniref:DUF1990 family protein n=1 Tax=Pseudonocardia sp. KRD291 TaxID=2792007 RepID=UPI001C49D72E|nr:DUF1990 family protein [Pseudonocardia sp. KRD291]MBW0100859.1 DUF1990 family protein [Pseudonocardia sp. KRD291]